ncbi:ABC transporter substrate-binding protein [Wenzhouxiangella marina]|uniref:ABC transporter substrate-binding protein n=2 Tax=Wenzhouxiangella marina TaxID=1579979 RepID=A0A0K0XSR7_9GAMM|nr:ABC transporter substrate-binding protein [Wenzhouxiangella marina]
MLALVIYCLPSLADGPRTVSLAPHLTELVFAVGGEDQLVGVVEHSDFPEAAQALPRIGDAFRFDLEAILTLDAELALAWTGGTPPAVADSLESLGIEVLWIETRRLEQIPAALRNLASALGEEAGGEQAAIEFEQTLAGLRARRPLHSPPVKVFYQVSARPLYTLGGRHIFNDVLDLCGMQNVFAGLDVEAAVVDREAVLAAEPELMLAAEGEDQAFADWLAGPLASVRHRRVDPDRLMRPTPRILDGARDLCHLTRP